MSSRTTSAGQPAAGTRAGQLGRFEEMTGGNGAQNGSRPCRRAGHCQQWQQGRGLVNSRYRPDLSCLRLALVKGGSTSALPSSATHSGVSWAAALLEFCFTDCSLFLPSSAEFNSARPLCNSFLLLGQSEIAGQPCRVGMTMAGHKRTAN